MRIFVGLGNPGKEYAANRHNLGFLAVDEIVHRHSFAPARRRFQSDVHDGNLAGDKILVLKPMTFMNESGRAVGEAMRFFKLMPADITVFHDELDLAPGKVRAKLGGGVAGHNGLKSIRQHIGPDFHRVRIGIGHPGDRNRVSGYVLSNFAKADHPWVIDVCRAIAAEADLLAKGDDAGFTNRVALHLAPAKPARSATKPADSGSNTHEE